MNMNNIVCKRVGGGVITLFLLGDRKGPWQVAETFSGSSWYIVNVNTKKYKRIGPVRSKGRNYFDEAGAEADRRNVKINAAE